jgi:hypothetical protein
VEHQTDIFSEREFQHWLVLLLESERERMRRHADAARDPQHSAGFYETSRNRQKETQHEHER